MRALASFSNLHLGETIVVCGCGQSLNELEQPERFISVGVNDIGRRFHPDYLVVVNPPDQFTGDRFRYVENSAARFLFTQLDLGLSRENVVRFSLGTNGGTDYVDPNVLHYTQNSPYVALCLAAHMGAKRIGLIGVDFTDHHFFAATGTHSLTPQLSIIDEQYRRLHEALKLRGIEVFNLSCTSRLTAFPKLAIADFVLLATPVKRAPVEPTAQPVSAEPGSSEKKIFFVNYKFLSCGEVFTDGLRHAATSLGLSFREAYWDDANLPAKVEAFAPHWLFVVHGRRFVERWGQTFPSIRKAVWLLDEPYEVDDTARWSGAFDVVYVNDPSTLGCHRNAHYLPVGYDSDVHRENGNSKKYQVGFVGGHNETRERHLLALQQTGCLSYVVGGPWRSSELRRICLAPNIPASETAELYRQTRVVVNLFRDIHHFNRRGIQAHSMNPRVYEALACGAVVVSETRSEIRSVFPELPVFSNAAQLSEVVRGLLKNQREYLAVKRACQEKLRAHNYQERLRRVCETLEFSSMQAPVSRTAQREIAMDHEQPHQQSSCASIDDWEPCGLPVETAANGTIVVSKTLDDYGPGTEQGLASKQAYDDVEMSFEVKIDGDACFIAKIRQASQIDQTTNSYHLYCHPGHTYLARHYHVFRTVEIKRDQWQQIKLKACGNRIELEIDGVLVTGIVDGMLQRGYCFLGVKSGKAKLRNLTLRGTTRPAAENDRAQKRQASAGTKGLPGYEVLYQVERREPPTVSIVTTVYDRVSNLSECVRSVKQLRYRDFEHIIVSDHPPDGIVGQIRSLLEREATGAVTFANLGQRFNNWGIAPASVGLHLARGRYVCFLSDDNGYTPDHLDPLVEALDHDNHIGFVYSSCQYAGRLVLRNPTPRPGGIDLGQPLFRREIFDRHLEGALPFDMMAWDWHMIETFMRCGVSWRHVDRPSFLFRLAACRKGVSA